MKRIKHIITSWLMITGLVFGQTGEVTNVGTTAASFLEIGVGARAIGMGGAFVATANDASAMYWNPAGLGFLSRPEMMFVHVDWLADIDFDFAGAMFPLGLKWKFTRGAPGDPAGKHIVANADESEPGTFKDRGLMEEDPFGLIEAMTLAAYVVGAENGWIFLRGEYPRCRQRLAQAIEQARAAGYLGRNLLGRAGFHFDIELRLGAGAYICGEETALFEAIEGKRGFPRIKPPFPTTHGLFNQPTAINNVETLVAALTVARIGLAAWGRYGTEDSRGTKWFCLSGHVPRPGLYELPFGVTVRELIEAGGGVREGRAVQAVLVGGAAGTFLGPEQLDYPLTYASSRNHAFPIGSGVVMVIDETYDLRQVLYHLAHFFAHESCGKCFPCQLGTQRQLEILQRVAHEGVARPGDMQTLLDIGFTMTQTSLCGLGQTAASAVVSAAQRFPDLLAANQEMA